ncbi:bifunctional transcriptional activator/DNA repair enzyme AdaA [Clostridium amazonitimonense]|uniref:bifunctional transcriptional activator/DNA repair enzyme AdaA n=1 Tax=Clostridium amazonitimonense TaxID=1499689 RepID=UPI00050964CD|nr:Ada metal-binding domain-containing protein [Clostridium amazonitimonense]
MLLSDEEKWKVVIDCDSSYDGQFFYGVKTTGIFCRPSCKSKSPKRDHVVFFHRVEQAHDAGFRPCKRCRPDLLEFEPKRETVERIKKVIDEFYTNPKQLKEEIGGLGISKNSLIRLFQDQLGMTPVQYINKLRIEKAKELLANSKDTILSIALQCGFGSLSTFYNLFPRLVGMSPAQYCKLFAGKKDEK